MNFFENTEGNMNLTTRKAICIFLAAILIFATGYINGTTSKVEVKLGGGTAEQSVQSGATTNAPVMSTTAPSHAVTAPSGDTTDDTAAVPPSGSDSLTSEEDIIALYNEAANKVKNEATKVTRNFKNTRYDASKSVLPSSLESMANPMMEKYIKDDVEPVEYLTKEEIIENFPAPKQEYSSVLTAADVDQAVCNDNGTEYEITLTLAPSFNPTVGSGVGAACHIMDTNSIKSNPAASSMLTKFDAIYEGCVIKCKIDKATNHLTWANFYTPLTIDALVNVVFSEVATTIVMSYERDYTVTY